MENKENIKAEDGNVVSSTDLLCEKPENMEDGDLVIEFTTVYKGTKYPAFVRLKKEEQNRTTLLRLIGTNGFIAGIIRRKLDELNIIPMF